ncbi:MAG: hypothetical protein A3B70_06050 [Deltaproteobacteria bacterium RIFCSPHIGHO2_02_FULL_40_11]|nr:MAG: hypothetical protein A3B70_06050 [Deltaproteobacteria bacterium RIFCSPHIGHO2_02_FULL_40_11]
MKIALLFSKQRADTWGIYVENALRKTKHEVYHFQPSDLSSLRNDFDLYFKIDDGNYNYDFPLHLKPKIYYVSDVHLKHACKKIIRQARNYDIIFCALKEGVGKFQRLGIKSYWINAACDPQIHKKLTLPKIYDIGFVGTSGAIPRQFYLQALREKYPKSYIDLAPHTKMGEIYSQSKIGFSYPIKENCFTMRSCEILSCGTFLLMKNIKDATDDTLEQLGFQDKKHLRIFHTPKEMFDIIDYYLKNGAERENIAQEGYLLIRKHHTYDDRVQEMLEIVRRELTVF